MSGHAEKQANLPLSDILALYTLQRQRHAPCCKFEMVTKVKHPYMLMHAVLRSLLQLHLSAFIIFTHRIAYHRTHTKPALEDVVQKAQKLCIVMSC